MSGEDPTEYGLLMPFVVVQSKGGPYDDAAYAAGWEMGRLDENLRSIATHGAPSSIQATVQAQNAPQVDLLAMSHGFTFTLDHGFEGVDWLNVTLTLTSQGDA